MLYENDPIKQFRFALLALVALVALGTLGYHILESWTLLDSLYMTVITLGTVGYEVVAPLDVPGKVFTIVLIVFGVTIVFWAGASLVQALVGEQIWHALQRKRMQKQISKMRNHFIICGFGRMGQQIVKDLQREDVSLCVIERNPEQMPKLVAQDIPFIEGNASDDKILKAAGIERAKGLITVAPTDEDNVFITLSARGLNPKLFIVARSIQEENEDKLKMAGADRVMSPYVMGGKRMAQSVLRPNVLDFLELAMHTDDLKMMIEELTIGAGSTLIKRSLGDSGLKSDTGISVIAVSKASGKMIANPGPEEILHEGDVLIVLGVPEQLDKAVALANPNRAVEHVESL
ncbi:MAG: potassium channel protein [Armatimonadota bacterium]|nr:potassium channel protein [bacterium]